MKSLVYNATKSLEKSELVVRQVHKLTVSLHNHGETQEVRLSVFVPWPTVFSLIYNPLSTNLTKSSNTLN